MVRSINEPSTPVDAPSTPTEPAPSTYINEAGETVYGDTVIPPTSAEPAADPAVIPPTSAEPAADPAVNTPVEGNPNVDLGLGVATVDQDALDKFIAGGKPN